ncbi:hypothetical protein BVY04_01490 [bacterium M21]|nr:hypothetical protein BVY04_01490 [bacterium M21]
METTLPKMDLNNLDKSDWQTFRFDQIAKSVSERVDPNNTDLETYIGLEHLDGESIHIKRFGTPDDVNGQKLRCYPGDVIFGKRRAYQRKAAIVNVDAFCSAHAMVLRANPDVIDPKLFPFFLHSDSFMHRAIDISVGSLSPTINWKTLRVQEFLLPPKDQQARIAELLWAMDEVVQKDITLVSRITDTSLSNTSEFFKDRKSNFTHLESVAEIRYGITLNSKRRELEHQAPYLRVANVARDKISLEEVKNMGCTKSELDRFSLHDLDVLIVEGHADIKEIGRAALWKSSNLEPMIHQNHLIRVRCNDCLRPEVLCSYVNSAQGQLYFQRNSKSTSGLNTINSTVVKKFKVPRISHEDQSFFIKRKGLLDKQLIEQSRRLSSSLELQKSLINQVF